MAETKFAGRGLHELQILLYVCSLLKVARPHIRNPLVYAAKAARQSCAKLSLKGQKLSLKSFQSKVRPNGCEYDFNAVVFISPKTAVYLSVRNCQWVNAKCYVRNSEEDSPYLGQVASISHRWIVLHISPDIPDDHCLVSPILYHNLAKNKQGLDVMIEFTNDFQFLMSSAFQKIVVLWHNAHSTEPSPEKDVNFQNGPQYASEVEVKYVESIKYKCGSQLEPLINDYFSEPKAVNIDDVLVIPLPSHLAYEFANSNCVLPPNYIFIKVCSVKRKAGAVTRQTMLVKKGVTSLYLSGTTQCPLPTLSQNINQVGKMDVPPVLANNCKKLKFLMEMEIKGSQQESCDCDVDMQVCRDCKEKDIVTEPCTPKEDAAKDSILSNLGQDYTECEDVMASASVLFLGPPGSGIEEVVNLAASDLGLEVLWIECWHLKGDTSGATEARVRQTFLRASSNSPCVLALRNVHCIAKDHDGNDDGRVVAALREEMTKLQRSSVILIATAPDRSHVSADLWSVWSHQETVQAPDILQRSLMLEWLFSMWVPKAKLHTLAQRTAGYIFGDFQALFNAAQRLCLYQLFLHQEIETKDNTRSKIPSLTYEDLLNALDELQSNRSEALGAPRIPQVRWQEVGGLEEAKREVVNTIQLPLRHPSLVSNGLRRSGVLLYGPPGTGKTLLAKAVATECGLNFMSVKGPELLNMYVGQSEENVRQVFARARAAAPCVIFFDELDSLAPNRGRSGDSGGVMDRIVSALLAELDGVASAADVFVLAATNRPDLIDPALLRPGRFEKLVFLGVCEDRASQVKILQAVTSKVPLAEDVSLERVATVLPLTLTGADLYALCTDALYTALQRTTQDIVEGKVKEEEAEILVREDDFKTAADQLVPSVTPRELLHYRNMNTNKR